MQIPKHRSIQNDTSTNQTQITPFTIPRASENAQEDASGLSSPTSNTIRANEADITLLSQRYNEEQFGDSIIGEGENNGTGDRPTLFKFLFHSTMPMDR